MPFIGRACVQARRCLKAWKAKGALDQEIATCGLQREKQSETLAKVQEEADKLAAEAAAAATAEAEGEAAANEEGEGDE